MVRPARRIDLERAEDIARQPDASSAREVRDATYWLAAQLRDFLDEDDEPPAHELRRYEDAHRRLTVWRRLSPRPCAAVLHQPQLAAE